MPTLDMFVLPVAPMSMTHVREPAARGIAACCCRVRSPEIAAVSTAISMYNLQVIADTTASSAPPPAALRSGEATEASTTLDMTRSRRAGENRDEVESQQILMKLHSTARQYRHSKRSRPSEGARCAPRNNETQSGCLRKARSHDGGRLPGCERHQYDRIFGQRGGEWRRPRLRIRRRGAGAEHGARCGYGGRPRGRRRQGRGARRRRGARVPSV